MNKRYEIRHLIKDAKTWKNLERVGTKLTKLASEERKSDLKLISKIKRS